MTKIEPPHPHIADAMTVHMGFAPRDPDPPATSPAPPVQVSASESSPPESDPGAIAVASEEPAPAAAPLPAGVAYGAVEALRWTTQLSARIQSTPLKQILGELLAECNPASPATLTFEPNRPNRIFRTLAEICLVLDERLMRIEQIEQQRADMEASIMDDIAPSAPAIAPGSDSSPGAIADSSDPPPDPVSQDTASPADTAIPVGPKPAPPPPPPPRRRNRR